MPKKESLERGHSLLDEKQEGCSNVILGQALVGDEYKQCKIANAVQYFKQYS